LIVGGGLGGGETFITVARRSHEANSKISVRRASISEEGEVRISEEEEENGLGAYFLYWCLLFVLLRFVLIRQGLAGGLFFELFLIGGLYFFDLFGKLVITTLRKRQ